MVSTLASHAGNAGSNPTGGTKQKTLTRVFFYDKNLSGFKNWILT